MKTVIIKTLIKTLLVITSLYLILCASLFFFQEKLLFHPEKLDKDYTFTFDQKFEEINIETSPDIYLNGLLFKAENSKGLIFYLHGNAGSLKSWGGVAKTYTDLNYDIFILDYRGYGKSDGSISCRDQLFKDLQIVYDEMKTRYQEKEIVLLGYSIGSGLAAHLASTNNPRLLILQAPYYSLKDIMKHTFPIIPTFLLRYQIETNEYIQKCEIPVAIFHGNQDEVIYYGSSLKLQKLLKPRDTFITLPGQGHNGMTFNEEYQRGLKKILK